MRNDEIALLTPDSSRLIIESYAYSKRRSGSERPQSMAGYPHGMSRPRTRSSG